MPLLKYVFPLRTGARLPFFLLVETIKERMEWGSGLTVLYFPMGLIGRKEGVEKTAVQIGKVSPC